MSDQLLHLHYGFEVRAVAEEKRSVDVVASTSAIDSYGEILVQDWDLRRYLSNPVVLYGHDSWSLPIGHASNVRVEDGKLIATLNFVDEKANPKAEQVWQGIKQGSLRAVSVGFVPRNKPTVVMVGDKSVVALSGNDLFEISVVPIPANPEAVTLGVRSFINRALAAQAPAKAPAQESTTDMLNAKSIIVALGLAADAEEFAILNAITALKACEKDLLAVTGKHTIAEALGAVSAVIESAKASAAEVADLKAKADARDREDIIRKGVAEKKLTPAQVAALADKSLDFVRGFVEMAHPNPALSSNHEEARHSTTQLEYQGKKWHELTPQEKHDLYHENRDLYEVMRDASMKRSA